MDLQKIRNYKFESNILTLGDDLILLDNIYDIVPDNVISMLDKEPNQIRDHVVVGIVDGCMKVRVNWKDLELKKNDIIVLRPGDIASLISIENCKLIILGFSNLFSTQKIDSKVAVLLLRSLENNACTHLTDEQFEGATKMYKGMRQILELENFEFKEEAINGVMQIGCAFASQWICDYSKKEIEKNKCETSQHRLFNKFLELVSTHHQKERTVTFYANELCITPKYLSQLVVNVSGKYACDIIRDQVIFRAKALLRSQQYTVQQVAELLTFSNVSFFCKYFRQAVGISPKAYMQNKNV